MTYNERLFHYTYASQQDEVHFMEFRILQRLNIFRLQNKLAELKASCWKELKPSDVDFENLKTTLHDYGKPLLSQSHVKCCCLVASHALSATAIQDYAFAQTLRTVDDGQAANRRHDLSQAFPEIADLAGDPFNSRYCTLSSGPGIPSDPVRNYLKRILPRRLTWTKAEMDRRMDDFLAGRPPEVISPVIDSLTRFVIAFMGGASLVVPVLIMSLPRTNRTKSLVVVSVAVTLFALLTSVGFRMNNGETVVSTATYAAVLVVFVGTSS